METTLAGCEVNVDLAPDLPPLEIDAVLLERVLCNLLENAARYAPGPIAITARLQDDRVEVMVSDTGPGISAGDEERIFEIFERGHRTGATGGVGLGLAICRAIVAAHGGSIAAENRQGGGLAVRFTLPVGNPPQLEEDAGD
jgi:two-component system sensor histidine kinase KdpD